MPAQRPGLSKQDYGTPKNFLEAARRRLLIEDFSIDLAATFENAVVPEFYSEQGRNAFQHPWNYPGWQWLNPEFGWIEPWVARTYTQTREHCSYVAVLVPGSIGANWWRDFVHKKCRVLCCNGRLKFIGAVDQYPKDCALLLYGPEIIPDYEVWTWLQQN